MSRRFRVAGVDRVFELNRNFRNEGADGTHNPEFTMLEAYQAYADYSTMLELAADLVRHAATAAHGASIALRPDGAGRLDCHQRKHGARTPGRLAGSAGRAREDAACCGRLEPQRVRTRPLA